MPDSVSTSAASPPVARDMEFEGDAAWLAVLSLSLGVFGLVTAEFLPASLLTPIARDLGISEGMAGQTVTMTAAIAMVSSLAMPILTRGFDRRLVMWSLTILLIVSSLLCAVATALPMLLVSRFVLGIGIGGFWSMSAAMAMRLVPPAAAPVAMSFIFAGVSLATVGAAPIGAYLGELIGWRSVFGLVAGIGAVTLIAQLLLLPSLPPRTAPSLGTLAELLGRRRMRLVLAVVLLLISGHFSGFTYVRPFLEQVPHLSVELISTALLAYGAGGFLGNFAVTAILARNPRIAVMLGASLIALSALVLIGFGADKLVAIGTIGFWGFAFGAIPVGTQAWIVRTAPDQPETASGMLTATFQVAIASGAIFGGLSVDYFGRFGAIAYAALVTILAVLLAATLRKA